MPAAVRALRRGEVVAYPTEGVFGLGCSAFDAGAVAKLLLLKRRAASKGLILLFAEVTEVRGLLAALPHDRRRAVLASWPGPVTWLLPAPAWIPPALRGRSDRVAVRVTAHPLARALCAGFGGALTSTSANLSGAMPLAGAASVRRLFGARLGAVVPGAVPRHGAPTAIIDALSGTVLRPGGAPVLTAR